MKLAVLHPGAMGSSVIAALVGAGHDVFWIEAERGVDSGRRAAAAGANPLPDLAALEPLDGVVSVCPPEAALVVADAVAGSGFQGAFLDANAVSPETARRIDERLADARIRLIDGGIVGPPAWTPGTTRLYLSGPEATSTQHWFEGGALEAIVLGPAVGAASALKMCYAAFTKGSSALLLTVRALADAEGVTEGLLAEWQRSQPGLGARSEATASNVAPKAWRFVGEMLEIAASLESRGLSGEFHRGAADLYRRLEAFKDAPDATIEEVLAALRGKNA